MENVSFWKMSFRQGQGVSHYEVSLPVPLWTYWCVLDDSSLDVAPDVAPVVNIELVVLEVADSAGTVLLHLPHVLPQLLPALTNSPANKSKSSFQKCKEGGSAYRDMSSVMWMLLPFNMAAFLRTCSLSLKSSKVTTMGRHPPTSGPVCILAAFVMTMSLLRERVCFSREFI